MVTKSINLKKKTPCCSEKIQPLNIKKLLANAAHSSKMGVWDCNLFTGQCYASVEWKELLGYQNNEIGCFIANASDLLHPDDIAGFLHYHEEYKKKISKCKTEEETPAYSYQYRMKHKSGSYRWIWTKGRVFFDRDKRLSHLVGAHIDITEQKEKEEYLENLKKEFESSNKELERFSSVVSHDLREPLHIVTVCLDLLSKKYEHMVDHEPKQLIETAKHQCVQAQTLISHILSYARIEGQKLEMNQVDLNKVLKEVLGNLNLLVSESGAEINAEFLPTVYGDYFQMIQLFQNLIGNAIKYKGSTPPKIDIGTKNEKDYYQFYVKDNGRGIDPKCLSDIFCIFTQIKRYENTDGYGIGLSICKKIVERHGGEIWVTSQENSGSCFYFTLSKFQNKI